jgi:hypothetical protein
MLMLMFMYTVIKNPLGFIYNLLLYAMYCIILQI